MKKIKYLSLSLLVLATVSCSKEIIKETTKTETAQSTSGTEGETTDGNGSPTDGDGSPVDGNSEQVKDADRIVLSGDITNEEAAEEISKKLGDNTKEILIANTTQLTRVDISEISELVFLKVLRNEKLTQLILPNLTAVTAGINFSDNIALETIDMPLLKNAGYFVFNNNDKITSLAYDIDVLSTFYLSVNYNENLEVIDFSRTEASFYSDYSSEIIITKNENLKEVKIPLVKEVNVFSIQVNPLLHTMNFSSLQRVGEDFIIRENDSLLNLSLPTLEEVEGRVYFNEYDSFATINFPQLKIMKSLGIHNIKNLTTISIPLLETVEEYLNIGNNEKITSVNFSKLISVGERINVYSNFNLKNVDFSNLVSTDELDVSNNFETLETFNLSSITSFNQIRIFSKLSEVDMDAVLARLVAITPAITGKDIKLKGTPSVTGEASATTLRNQGNSVVFYN